MMESTFFSFASFPIQTVQVSSEREVEKFFSFQLLNPKFLWIAEANSWWKVIRQHHKRSVVMQKWSFCIKLAREKS